MGRRRRVRRRSWQPILWGLLALAALGGLAGAFYFKVPADLWEDLLPVLEEGKRVTVLVEPGMNARQVARVIEEQGALEGPASQLVYWMIRLGVDRRIRPGYYEIIRSSPWYVARQLRGMDPTLLRMTVIPGSDVFSLREALSGDLPPGTGDALGTAVMDDANYPGAMRAKLPADEESRIAFLQPETYLVVERTPQELVKAASSAWWDLRGASADALPQSGLREAAIVASMVEREVLHDSECRRVAGVIHNRLRERMPLQIDATVVYAWKLRGRRLTRVLNSDLTIDSPYNTYRVPGLPPRPICVPGSAAWDAALDPETHNYYYYVARKDGYHYFGKTYAEHLDNVKRARSEP